MHFTPAEIVKTYSPRGPLQQFRFNTSSSFDCVRCHSAKKSKLITIYNGDWSKRLCNGCYGLLLSIYDIKSGISIDDDRAESLSDLLRKMVAVAEVEKASRLFEASEKRANLLSREALSFVATSEVVATRLHGQIDLEWSPAVIGLCKALEKEIVHRIIYPLSTISTDVDLAKDKKDKDLSKMAAFCFDNSRKPPELGVFAHFVQTVIYSKERRTKSDLIQSFLSMLSNWPNSHWILDPSGIHADLKVLIKDYRNPAAHIDELGEHEYRACWEKVVGPDGMLWKLIVSTTSRK